MPQRFVEVLDLSAEASLVLSRLATQASGLATDLKLNVTEYINATAGNFDSRLVSMLESYNITRQDIFDTMSLLNLNMTNTTLSNIDRPKPISSLLMSIGTTFIFLHLVIVHVSSRKLVSEVGNHS